MTKPSLRHRALQAAIRGFNLNPWTSGRLELLPRDDRPLYTEDGLWTHHDHTFVTDPRFDRAYRRAVQATGDDYEIRWRVHTLPLRVRSGRAQTSGGLPPTTGGRAHGRCTHVEEPLD